MSSRPGSTALASRTSLPPTRRNSGSSATSAVAKAAARSPPAASNRTTATAGRTSARRHTANASSGNAEGTFRRIDRSATRPIALVARASLSQNRPSVPQRSPRGNGADSVSRIGSSTRPTLSPSPQEAAVLDDESFALALARDEDEAFALSIAREQENVNDAAMWSVGGFGGTHRSQQFPWDFDDSLAAALAAATTGTDTSSLLGSLLAHPMVGNTSMIDDPPRARGPSLSQIQRLPTRTVSAESLAGGQNCGEPEECPVCFASYEVGDELRTLPCMHAFHVECIDRWLTSGREGASACPVCHCDVNL